MLVQGGMRGDGFGAMAGRPGAHGGYVQGATALKGDFAESARELGRRRVRRRLGDGRRQARRGAHERLRRRGLPGVREFHDGAQRDVLEVRYLRGDDGVFVKVGERDLLPAQIGLGRPQWRLRYRLIASRL